MRCVCGGGGGHVTACREEWGSAVTRRTTVTFCHAPPDLIAVFGNETSGLDVYFPVA